MFHTPKTIGERTRLKMTPLLRGLSWGSLALQAGSSIFSIVGYVALTQAGYVDGWILLVLPIVMWVLSIVARLGSGICPWICGGCRWTCGREWWSARAGI